MTVDGLIELDFVKRHVIFPGGFDESFWREIFQTKVAQISFYFWDHFKNVAIKITKLMQLLFGQLLEM